MSAVLAILAPIAQPTLPDINVAGELLRVLLSLAGIVVLIFAAGWIGRRQQGRPFAGGRRLRHHLHRPGPVRHRLHMRQRGLHSTDRGWPLQRQHLDRWPLWPLHRGRDVRHYRSADPHCHLPITPCVALRGCQPHAGHHTVL